MNKDYTHICVILDASGSMHHLEQDTKGSFNSFIDRQRKEAGKTVFDLYQFSNDVRHLVDNADLTYVSRSLMDEYRCGGCTALNDAVCTAIDELGARFAAMKEEDRPARVAVAILTDGMENASHKFSADDVKKRIEHQQSVYNWDFIYLAADLNAFEAAESLGLKEEDRVMFDFSPAGMKMAAACFCARVQNVRKKK